MAGHGGSEVVRRAWAVAAIVLLSAVAVVAVTTRLRLDPDVAALLPTRGDSAALRSYLRAFGGSDLAVVLVEARGADTRSDEAIFADVEAAARKLAEGLRGVATIEHAVAAIPASGDVDPWLVWRHADGPVRARLNEALSPAGMRRRLEGSRAALLVPGAGAVSERVARDPLRLVQLLGDARAIGSGFRPQADGSLASDDGRSRLVLVLPRGQALRGEDARAFVRDARGVITQVERSHEKLRFGLTGGHAIGEATERMLEADLKLSGVLSLLLAALAFGLCFRRLRALLAVMPPLLLGTLWTAGVAAAMPAGLSAVAVAFMSVVIGVGVDTGVHVYGALLEARRAGLAPSDAARLARRQTQRPVLVAAATAAAAFASLTLSEIGALRQLGILCAAGEVLTAVAIVTVTPVIGSWLEVGDPPAETAPRWTGWVASLTAGRARSFGWLVLIALPVGALFVGFGPRLSEAVVALRPAKLQPLQVQQRIYESFGGRSGQWVIMVSDADRAKARARSDRIAESLALLPKHVSSVDTLTAIAPAPETQRRRLAERDSLDLAANSHELRRALVETGFAPDRFEQVLASMRAPSDELVSLEALRHRNEAIMLSRYLGRDGDQFVVVSYVLPVPGSERIVEQAVRDTDADAVITGYGRLETSLRDTLSVDLPRIGGLAALLVMLALVVSLRRLRDVAIAAGVVVAEVGIVCVLIRIFDVPLHAYDALVLPVLLGITVDEAMFLLYRARSVGGRIGETLRHEGPLIATTALTTAAGFGGLLICDFDGLRHLGMVGVLGSLGGLLVALLVVPAGLRLARR